MKEMLSDVHWIIKIVCGYYRNSHHFRISMCLRQEKFLSMMIDPHPSHSGQVSKQNRSFTFFSKCSRLCVDSLSSRDCARLLRPVEGKVTNFWLKIATRNLFWIYFFFILVILVTLDRLKKIISFIS